MWLRSYKEGQRFRSGASHCCSRSPITGVAATAAPRRSDYLKLDFFNGIASKRKFSISPKLGRCPFSDLAQSNPICGHSTNLPARARTHEIQCTRENDRGVEWCG
jgi:hypothetical protein